MSRILVIEDSPAIALLLRRRLEMAGHAVEVAGGGAQALGMIDADDLPDVVLTDVMMPGMDGIETMRRIRSSYHELSVILVTAQQLEPDLREEADAVISKPIDFRDLFAEIARLAP